MTTARDRDRFISNFARWPCLPSANMHSLNPPAFGPHSLGQLCGTSQNVKQSSDHLWLRYDCRRLGETGRGMPERKLLDRDFRFSPRAKRPERHECGPVEVSPSTMRDLRKPDSEWQSELDLSSLPALQNGFEIGRASSPRPNMTSVCPRIAMSQVLISKPSVCRSNLTIS